MGDLALQTRLTEDIALLEFLGKVPVAPSKNLGTQHDPGPSAGRTLTLRAERDLATTLAFLSSIRDDANNVTAVCVREADMSLSVLVAANIRELGASPYLESVKRGFEQIFGLLRTASTSKSRLSNESQY